MAKDKTSKVVPEHDTKNFRQLSVDELKKKLLVFSKDQFKLRMQKGAGQLTKPHLVKQVRRSIAKIKTVLTEKKV
jgi:large subunit ribosomal protein L29